MWPKKRVIDDIFTKFGGDTGGMEDARLEPLALLWIYIIYLVIPKNLEQKTRNNF
jgi:hypothetical protein